MKSAIRSTKLDPQYFFPFEIIYKKSLIAYKLAFPPSLSKMHSIFHVSLLRKYVVDPSHVLDFSYLHMLNPQAIEVLPVRILAFRTKKLINKDINYCLL